MYLWIVMVGWLFLMVECCMVLFYWFRVKESELLERLGVERYGQLWLKVFYGEGFWGRVSRVVLLWGIGGVVFSFLVKVQLICVFLVIQLLIRLCFFWVICVMLFSGMICEVMVWVWIFGVSCWICCGVLSMILFGVVLNSWLVGFVEWQMVQCF